MRNKKHFITILITVFFLVTAISLPINGVRAGETQDQADFELVEDTWSVEPGYIETGEKVTIQGEVENLGSERDSDYVDFYIDGNQEDYEVVTLDPDEKASVSFEYENTDETGIYDVEIKLDSFDSQWSGEFEVKKETVDSIEIYLGEEHLDEEEIITAGDSKEFSAEAYNRDGKRMDEFSDENFTWHNAGDTGIFDRTEAGTYEVWAELEDIESEKVQVTVEPAEPSQLFLVDTPSEDTIQTNEDAEFVVEVRDKFGNIQEDGSFKIELIVGDNSPLTGTIQDGESRITLIWTTTREPGDYTISVSSTEGDLDSTEEVSITVTEAEDESLLNNFFFWVILVVFVIMIPLTIIYAWKSIDHNFGKKKPQTHEWKREKDADNES